jgi:uroporphyrinogen-III synthase
MPGGVPTIIVTRPDLQAREFSGQIRERFHDSVEVIVSPILEIMNLPLSVEPEAYQTFIFTSANGVRAFAASPALAGRTAYCVGKRTGAEARKVGFNVVIGKGDADDLADMILRETPKAPWLHVSGEHTRGNLADRLRTHSHPTDHVIVYRQEERPLSDEALAAINARRVLLPVFSPRTATLLSEMLPDGAPEPDVAAISSAAAGCWHGPVRRLAIAAEPNSSAMLDILGMLVRTDSQS